MPLLSVLNRYSEPVEIQFDAANNPDSPYHWAPGEVKVLPQDAAIFCRRKSVVREDPITGEQTRALVVQGIDSDYAEWVDKLIPSRGPELLDRENMAPQDRDIKFVSLKNPLATPGAKESLAVESRARRVSQ